MGMMRATPQTSSCATPASSSTTLTRCREGSRAASALPAIAWAGALAHHRCEPGERIAAAASFHGGNLANADDPDSPHHKASAIKAAVYVAGAIEDQSFTDDQKDLLEKSLSEAGVIHTIETYQAITASPSADNPSYDPHAAERHWEASERFFGSCSSSDGGAQMSERSGETLTSCSVTPTVVRHPISLTSGRRSVRQQS